MKTGKRSVLGIWVISITFLFQLVFSLYALFLLKHNNITKNRSVTISVFSGMQIILLSCLLIETGVYWLLQKKIKNIVWVRVHVWTLFCTMVLLPLILSLISFYLTFHFNTKDYTKFAITIWKVKFYSFWTLIITGHVFFVLTIIKSFKTKKIVEEKNESAGLLDEFVN